MYKANAKWGEFPNTEYTSRLSDTYDGAIALCNEIKENERNSKSPLTLTATWITLSLDDYSHLYCPYCLERLPKNGSHWNSCFEYEASDCYPEYFPLTEKQMLNERINNINQANKKRNQLIRDSKKQKAEYEERLKLLNSEP